MHRLLSSLLLLLGVFGLIRAGIFRSNGDVKLLDVTRLKKHLASSSKGTMVVFYAPWCGHCRSLQPEYEKAAANLKDLVIFVAIDCDASENKAACGSDYQVRGFPTLQYYAGLPTPTPYNGARKAKDIVDFSLTSMPNFAKKIKTSEEINRLVSKATPARPLVVLFTEATKTTPLFKSLSSAIYKKMDVYTATPAAIGADTPKTHYGVQSLPTLMIFQGDQEDERHKFTGKMNYQAIFEFCKAILAQKDAPPKKESPGKATGEL